MKSKPKSSKSKQPKLPEPTPQEKLQTAEQNANRWAQVAQMPDLSAPAAAAAKGLARSAQAELSLRRKALEHLAPPNEQPENQTLGTALALSQPVNSAQANPPSSTGPEISA